MEFCIKIPSEIDKPAFAKQRKEFWKEYLSPFISQEFYVVEQMNIDGIVIWQSKDGAIFQSKPNNIFMKINESLLEYINEE